MSGKSSERQINCVLRLLYDKASYHCVASARVRHIEFDVTRAVRWLRFQTLRTCRVASSAYNILLAERDSLLKESRPEIPWISPEDRELAQQDNDVYREDTKLI